MKMKAISLWQPWASLMMTGAKHFETRHWPTNYRGPLVIHAAKGGLTKGEMIDLMACQAFSTCWKFQGALAPLVGKPFNPKLTMHGPLFGAWPGVKPEHLPRGCALGIVNLLDCIRTEDLTQGEIAQEMEFGNFELGRFAWKTELVRVFDQPIPVKGMQGLFDIDIVE